MVATTAAHQPDVPATPLSPLGGVDLALCWENVTYTVGDKEILKGLNGTLRPRRALAIMGSSGAGKTTFLNAVSDRLANNSTNVVGGSVTLNGVPYDRKYRRLLGFVPQDDVLSQQSTPAEVLAFSLRIRRGTDVATTTARVDEMLGELQLTKCRDTVVGTPGLEVGLSGGERKRTNIGVELICDPKILMLDEPTSGLDSVTAETVILQLQQLARRGRTVAYTIHQPTSDCFNLFDDIMLMVAGKVIYHGPASEAVDYFSKIGYECPDHYTPSDYFMQLMQDEDIGQRLVELWAESLRAVSAVEPLSPCLCAPGLESKHMTERYLAQYEAHGASYTLQLTELFKRSSKGQLRNTMHVVSVLVQAVIFGVICALIFVNLKDNTVGVADRHGLFFIVIANVAFSAVEGTINVFPPERAVFLREQQTGSYSPLLFFIAKTFSEIPLAVVASVVSAVLIYFPTRLVADAGAFFIFTAVTILLQQVGIGIGLCISVGIENYELASALSTIVVIPSLMAGGLMASTDRLRPAWVWLEKTSYIRWAYVLLERNEFERLGSISCDAGKFGGDFCARQPTDGNGALDAQELRDGHHEKWLMWLLLAVGIVVPRIFAVGLLYLFARRKN